jgi:hypothetical protein
MDVFKLAFETTIVGLLAFLWLGIATYLLFPDFLIDLLTKKIPALVKANQASMGVAVLTVAYCLGSAILPIADQLVNDEHWPLREDAIRCQVFTKQHEQLKAIGYTELPMEELKPLHCSYWAPILDKGYKGIGRRILQFLKLWAGFPATEDHGDKDKIEKILTVFEQEESTVLNQSSDKMEQLRQLHERIVVLRGAVFSGFVLLLICLSAYFAQVHGHPSHWMRPVCGILLAVSFTVFSILNGYHDLADQNIFDIPVLESLLAVITIFGLVLVFRGVKTQLFRTKRCVLIAIFFTSLTYGGWMWSEIIYDQQVISSFAVLRSNAKTQKN